MLFSAEQAREMLKALHPLGRISEGDDIAKVIYFLASDDAALITGQEIYNDGGLRLDNKIWVKPFQYQQFNKVRIKLLQKFNKLFLFCIFFMHIHATI